ncbi:MAG: adenosine deaminase, partial [Ignavibacteriales bacterium]|nr:adenosine deaminase [Ignavibacteriales bacterium]
LAHDVFSLSLHDLEKLTINAMKSAFIPYKKRIDIIYNVIKPGYTKARMALDAKKNRGSKR